MLTETTVRQSGDAITEALETEDAVTTRGSHARATFDAQLDKLDLGHLTIGRAPKAACPMLPELDAIEDVAPDDGRLDREIARVDSFLDRRLRTARHTFTEEDCAHTRIDHRPAPARVLDRGVQVIADRGASTLDRTLHRLERGMHRIVEIARELVR